MSLIEKLPSPILACTIASYLIDPEKRYPSNPERAFFITSRRFSLLEADFFVLKNEIVDSLLQPSQGRAFKLHPHFLKTAKKICSLNLSNILLGNYELEPIMKCLPNLRRIYLNGCTLDNLDFSSPAIFSQLSTISLRENKSISTLNFVSPNLKWLNMEGCNVHPSQLQKLATCSTLKAINLSENSQLSASNISTALQSHKELTDLNLSGFQDLADKELSQVAINHPLLERLALARCRELSGMAVSCLGALQQMKSLDLSFTNTNDAALALLVKNHPKLEELYLMGADITNEGLKPIAELKSLEVLDLSYCNSIDDVGLGTLAGKLPQLQALLLNKCANLSQKGYKHIPTFPMLRILEITAPNGIHSAPPLTLKLHELEELVFRNFYITVYGEEDSIASCLKLKRLELSDFSIRTIGILQKLPHLKSLTLCYRRAQPLSVEMLSPLKDLRELCLKLNCNSPIDKSQLQQILPNTRITLDYYKV